MSFCFGLRWQQQQCYIFTLFQFSLTSHSHSFWYVKGYEFHHAKILHLTNTRILYTEFLSLSIFCICGGQVAYNYCCGSRSPTKRLLHDTSLTQLQLKSETGRIIWAYFSKSRQYFGNPLMVTLESQVDLLNSLTVKFCIPQIHSLSSLERHTTVRHNAKWAECARLLLCRKTE